MPYLGQGHKYLGVVFAEGTVFFVGGLCKKNSNSNVCRFVDGIS
jgi:hypothetical protein